ncbi:TIM barrel protein [Bosea sp. ASV33]|uniref:sugar phosphate isomerase/epimerase family protein n=1 Tax=Bosea sp. ASV33 TaxID=2795106 RepID=UPI0018EC2C04|nr:TIM barrel protein [Bosea sp. ASV33]
MTDIMPPLGIAHFSCIEVPPLEFVRLSGEIGYAAVGLRLHPAFQSAPFYTLRPGSAEMRSVKVALQQAGIAVYDIEFVVIDEAFSASELLPVLESAGELGARRLSVCGDDPDRSRFAANLTALAELAAEFGMAVDLEIMPWRRIGTLAAAADAVEATRRTNISVLIDALHLSRSGAVPADLRSVSKELVRSVQLCDAVAERPSDNAALVAEARGGRLFPGQGALPLQDLLRAVPSDATLSVEVPNTGLPAERHAKALFDATIALFGRERDTVTQKPPSKR